MATKAQLEDALNNPNVQKFLDLLSFTEGTQKHQYRTAYGGSKIASLDDHPRKTYGKTREGTTSAAGRYQFVKGTWDGLAKKYDLPDFGANSQDIGALGLIAEKGALQDVLNGDFQSAIKKTNTVWASLPGGPYSQPTKSWKDINKFLNTDYNPSDDSSENNIASQEVPIAQPSLEEQLLDSYAAQAKEGEQARVLNLARAAKRGEVVEPSLLEGAKGLIGSVINQEFLLPTSKKEYDAFAAIQESGLSPEDQMSMGRFSSLVAGAESLADGTLNPFGTTASTANKDLIRLIKKATTYGG